VRIGLYNRYWSTRGGGERYAGVVAETLARDHDVELVGVEDISFDEVAEHLGLDFSGMSFRRWPVTSEKDLAPLTARYDLFLNGTYLSRLPSRSHRSAYLVLFPQKVLRPGLALPLERAVDNLAERWSPPVVPVEGFYETEAGGRRWSGERAVLFARRARRGIDSLRVAFEPLTPWSLTEALIDVKPAAFDWRVEGDELVLQGFPESSEAIYIDLTCRPFVPADLGTSSDRRRLGVCLAPASSSSASNAVWWMTERFRGLVHSHSPKHLDSYQLLISISEYTRDWISRRWRRSSEVLEPPLDRSLFAPCREGPKEKLILSVGRFFSGSHNKKHLEMLKVFRSMCDGGEVPEGWEYHLVGNLHRGRLEDLEYFSDLERLADGYPVRLLPDQPLQALLGEYRRASIFWHAAGWGESDSRAPEKFEHFGLTTCEAMCAGCIPVVIAKAGQLEIVTDGQSGFLFSSPRELASATRRLIEGHGQPWLEEMRERAASEVSRFDRVKFEQRLLALLAEQGLLS
jgi:glycosyltransferase involved in cell wall biosynthesis